MATGKDRQQHNSHYDMRESAFEALSIYGDNPVPIGLVQNKSEITCFYTKFLKKLLSVFQKPMIDAVCTITKTES